MGLASTATGIESLSTIRRTQGAAPRGRVESTCYGDLVWTVSTAQDEDLNLTEQTRQTLQKLEENLIQLGSDKSRILSATVYIANIDEKPIMDIVWNEWIGEDPKNWPQRACLGVSLGGNWLIEVTVTALKCR